MDRIGDPACLQSFFLLLSSAVGSAHELNTVDVMAGDRLFFSGGFLVWKGPLGMDLHTLKCKV
jgi:hypothetical protein